MFIFILVDFVNVIVASRRLFLLSVASLFVWPIACLLLSFQLPLQDNFALASDSPHVLCSCKLSRTFTEMPKSFCLHSFNSCCFCRLSPHGMRTLTSQPKHTIELMRANMNKTSEPLNSAMCALQMTTDQCS